MQTIVELRENYDLHMKVERYISAEKTDEDIKFTRNEVSGMAKKLVAYFSASGMTKRAAEKLAKQEDADLFEIKPVQPYTDADLNWMDKKSRSTAEMQDKNSRVEIVEKVSDMNQYDEIFLGFPIWWGVAPHIINSFLEQYDLKDRTISPFATSGGSGYGHSNQELEPSAPDAKFNAGRIMK